MEPHLLLLESCRVNGHGGQAAVPGLRVLGQLVVRTQLSYASATATLMTHEQAKYTIAARRICILHTSALKPR